MENIKIFTGKLLSKIFEEIQKNIFKIPPKIIIQEITNKKFERKEAKSSYTSKYEQEK